MGRYGNYRPANPVMEGITAFGAVDDLYQKERDRETAKQDRERRIRREDVADQRGALEFKWKEKDRAQLEKKRGDQETLESKQALYAIIEGAPKDADEKTQRRYYEGVYKTLGDDKVKQIMKALGLGEMSREQIAQQREIAGRGIANGAMLMSGQTADSTDALNALNTFGAEQINQGGGREGANVKNKKITGFSQIPNGKVALKMGVDAEDSTGLKETYESFMTTLRDGNPQDTIRQFDPEQLIDALVGFDSSMIASDVMLAMYGDQAAMGRVMESNKNKQIAGAIDDPLMKKLLTIPGVTVDQAQTVSDKASARKGITKTVPDVVDPKTKEPAVLVQYGDGSTEYLKANKLTAQAEADAKNAGDGSGDPKFEQSLDNLLSAKAKLASAIRGDNAPINWNEADKKAAIAQAQQAVEIAEQSLQQHFPERASSVLKSIREPANSKQAERFGWTKTGKQHKDGGVIWVSPDNMYAANFPEG